MKTQNVGLVGALALALAVINPINVSAVSLLFDRGLPGPPNLNNAAGSSRNNVAWADVEPTATPSEYWLPGDNFTLGAAAAIDTIRVWTVGGPTTGFTLRDATGAAMSSTFTVTPVTYSGGATYQGSSGSFITINQIDFDMGGAVLGAGTHDFFLDGPWSSLAGGGYVNSFLHAANAALAGTTQEGSDNLFQFLHIDGLTATVETWDSNGSGWDKSSDGNVQVLGRVVPDNGSNLVLAAVAIASLVGFRKLVPLTT